MKILSSSIEPILVLLYRFRKPNGGALIISHNGRSVMVGCVIDCEDPATETVTYYNHASASGHNDCVNTNVPCYESVLQRVILMAPQMHIFHV